jgi:hypothetical protein
LMYNGTNQSEALWGRRSQHVQQRKRPATHRGMGHTVTSSRRCISESENEKLGQSFGGAKDALK